MFWLIHCFFLERKYAHNLKDKLTKPSSAMLPAHFKLMNNFMHKNFSAQDEMSLINMLFPLMSSINFEGKILSINEPCNIYVFNIPFNCSSYWPQIAFRSRL